MSQPRVRRPPIRRRLLGVAGAAALAGIAALGGPWAYTQALSFHRQYTVATVPLRPVALVLGAEIYPSGRPSPFLKGRLDIAHDLYRAKKVRAIVVSGDNGEEHYNEPDGMRDYLIRAGVPANKVIADYAGFDTYDSCVRAKRIFGVDRLTIVTQGYHLPRALATCRAVGVDAVGVGDYTVRPDSKTWVYGEIREVPANVKMIWDVVSRRTPLLGPRETSVDEAVG